MSSSLEIDNQKMKSVAAAAAAAAVGYSRDYVTKLARDKKITAVQVGRQWFVEFSTLEDYATKSLAEHKVRQQQLSQIRKAEREAALQKNSDTKIATPFSNHLKRQPSAVAMMSLIVVASAYSLIHFSPSIQTGMSAQVTSSTVTPEFQTAETLYARAVGDSVTIPEPTPLPVDFSHESVLLSDIANLQNGLLLLPQATTAEDISPENFFSNRVKILTDESGQQYVARVDEQNQVISEIPFVMVPVAANQDMP